MPIEAFTRTLRSAAAALLLCSLAAAGASAQIAGLRAGVDYRPVEPPQPTTSARGRVEVVEVFRYSCPACMTIDPLLSQWHAQAADYVDFVLLPAGWSDLEQQHARAFYTAEVLGKLDEMHSAFFNEIHVKRNRLESAEAIAEFFGRFGVDRATFDKTFKSMGVQTKMLRANDLIRRYRVSGTPNIVVNGKYVTDGSGASSYGEWFGIVDRLAAAEHEAE